FLLILSADMRPGSAETRSPARPACKSEVGWRKTKPGGIAMSDTQRVAIVTGAAGGIGRAMTQGLLAAGTPGAGGVRDPEPLEALAASAREQGRSADLFTIQADLTSDSATEEISQTTRDRFGRIDILVNNAGIGPGSIRPDSWQRPLKFWEITPDQWRRFVAVHTTAPLALTNAVVPEMMRQRWAGSST